MIERAQLTKMNKDELAALAQERFGEDLSGMKKSEMVENIVILQEQAAVQAPETPQPSDAVEITDQTGPVAPAAKRKARIVIPAADGELGGEDVFVSVNGYAYQIKRDAEVTVPEEVVETLRNATYTAYREVDGEMQGRDVQRYPFQIIEWL